MEASLGLVVGVVALVLAGYSVWRQRLNKDQHCAECAADWSHKESDWKRTEKELRDEVTELRAQVEMLIRQLTDAFKRIRDLEKQVAEGKPAPAPSPIYDPPALLVAIGPDAKLQVDLAALRAVTAATGLRFSRLLPVTFDSFRRTLQRRREAGHPIKYVHLSVHAGPDGVQFCERTVSGLELSGVVQDVQVLLLAGCEADEVGDLLGVVPAVVTLREEITHEDASSLTHIFWQAIGEGLGAEGAMARVDERCPAVAEYVEFHQ